MDRAEQSKESRLNNVRSVRGPGFDDSPENLVVLAQIESEKNAYLLNALSYLVNNQVIGQEVPQLVAEIQTSLQERGLEIPDQPNPQFERPLTSSSQRSG